MEHEDGGDFVSIDLPVTFKGHDDGLWASFQKNALFALSAIASTVFALVFSAKSTLSLEFHFVQPVALAMLFYAIHMVGKSNRIKKLIDEKDFTCIQIDDHQIVDFMTFYPDIGVIRISDIDRFDHDAEAGRITFKLTNPYQIRRRSNAILRFMDLLRFAYEGSIFPRTYRMDVSHLDMNLHKFLFILNELKHR